MKFITVNPTWNVPPSIIQNEYLPALQQDPQAMERIGLKVEQNRDGTVRIYQPPGDRNALGRIRFNFPNKFLVYQHDTPDKHLFAHDKRAYSHGCMRVENPLKYGEVILGLALPNEHYTADRLQKMFGGSEININFPTGIPVHLTYQTAFVDDAGKLQIRDDVYGRDAAPAGDPQGLRAQDGRHRHRPAEGQFVGAGEDAARHLRQRRQRGGSGFVVLRAAVRRQPGAGARSRAPASAPTSAGSPRANAVCHMAFIGTRPQPIAAAELLFRAHVAGAREELSAWRSTCRRWSPRSRPPSTATKRR